MRPSALHIPALALALPSLASLACTSVPQGRSAIDTVKVHGADGINADDAFALLRSHSQHGGGRLSDIAAAVVDTNALLPEAERRSASGDPI